jgi:hypothetical protein
MEEVELSAKAKRQDAALESATERMRAERLKIDAQNRALEALIEREEQLAANLQAFLDNYHRERQALEAEKSRILSAISS